MGSVSALFVVVGIVLGLIGIHLFIASQPHTITRRNSKRFGTVGGGFLIFALIIVLLPSILANINSRLPNSGTVTPTPEMPQPVLSTQGNTFVAGQTWKGTGHTNGGWTTEQATLKVDTINPDGSTIGTFEWNDQTMVSDKTYSLKGNIVHEFSDGEWNTILGYQGMDPKSPGIWLQFTVQSGFDDSDSTPFYAVARPDGSLDGYWVDLSISSTPRGEIHLHKSP